MARTVRAVQQGFYNGLRNPGDVFEIVEPASQIDGTWFEPVDTEAKTEIRKSGKAKNPVLRGDEPIVDQQTGKPEESDPLS